MKYSSYIDNITAKEWGLNVQLAYLFDWIYTLSSWASSINVEGDGTYYFASKTKAIEELPLLSDRTDTIYRYYKALDEDFGLIYLRRFNGKDYIRLTEKAKCWGKKLIRDSDLNPTSGSKVGKISGLGSDLNPTYKNTILDKNTITDELKSSSSQIPELFSKDTTEVNVYSEEQQTNTARVGKKSKKDVEPCHSECKKAWLEAYPLLGWGKESGACLNRMISATKTVLISHGLNDPPPDRVIHAFKNLLSYVKEKGHWAHGKPITTFSGQYGSIIHEMKHGKQKSESQYYRNLNTADRLRELPVQDFRSEEHTSELQSQ